MSTDSPAPRHVVDDVMVSLARQTFREFQVHGVATPFTGRRAELAEMTRAFDLACQTGRLVQIGLTGDEGIGKSRLMHQFSRALRHDRPGTTVLSAEARGHGASAAAVVAQMLRSRYRCSLGDSDDDMRAKLERGLASRISPKRLSETVALLGSLLGLPIPQDMLYRGIPDPAAFRRQALHQFGQQLLADCAQGPHVVVFDRIDNMEPDQLGLLAGLIESLRNGPILVVFLSRHELPSPPVANGVPMTSLNLKPLEREDTWALLGGLLGDIAPYQAHLGPAIESIGGHPQRLEELVRSLVNKGVLEAKGALLQVDIARIAESAAVPTDPWLAADSRLGDLKSVELEVLGVAAVFGRNFWYDGVLSLLWSGPRGGTQALPGEDKLDRALHRTLLALMRGDHVRYVQPSQVKGVVELVFSNPFERTSLLRRMAPDERTARQLRAGRWMLNVSPVDPQSWYRRAAELLDAGGRPWEAANAWLRTAEAALDHFEIEEALEAFDKATDRLDHGDSAAMLPVYRGRARAFTLREDYERALKEHNRVFIAARIISDRTLAATAVLEQGRCLANMSAFEQSSRCVERAAKSFDELADIRGLARAEETFAEIALATGGTGAQEKTTWHRRRAMKLWRQAKHPAGLVRNALGAAIGLIRQGDFVNAKEAAATAHEYCEHHDLPVAERVASLNLQGSLALLYHQPDAAILLLRKAIRLNDSDGAVAEFTRLTVNLSLACLRAGEVAIAEDRVREALDVAREAGDPMGCAYANWRLGTVLATRGSLTAALEALSQSFQAGEALKHKHLRAVAAQTLASLWVETDREEPDLATRIEGLLKISQRDALALDDVTVRAPVLETLASYYRRFSPESTRAAEAMNAARTLLDSETSEMSLSADSSNVIVARARRIALQPLLWTAP